MVIASEHSETQGIGSGKGVEEGLLLDRIELKRPDIAGRDVQGSSPVKADPTDPVAAVADQTPVPAGETAKLVIGELLVELAFLHMLCEKLLEG